MKLIRFAIAMCLLAWAANEARAVFSRGLVIHVEISPLQVDEEEQTEPVSAKKNFF